MPIHVSKADGTTEAFDPLKLRSSLHKAGASDDVTVQIVDAITKGLYEGITTEEIYRRAFALLRDHRREAAAHYSLKRALFEFGPSGFPFETYLGELFKTEGFADIRTDQIVQGGCVEHEVDVVMNKEKIHYYVEAKFHNTPALKTDLKVVLYVKARIDDLKVAMKNTSIIGYVVTNTKFTDKAVQYASCEGLELLSWDYPHKQNLHTKIEQSKLYPITALTGLSKHEKVALLGQKVVLCRDLQEHTEALISAGVTSKRLEHVLQEAAALCASGDGIL